jgi:hypothetical protein
VPIKFEDSRAFIVLQLLDVVLIMVYSNFKSVISIVFLVMQPESVDSAENDDTISCHIKTMQAELKKNAPNIATIEDRMQRTLVVRRAAVKEKLRSEILEEYPALRMDAQVNIM